MIRTRLGAAALALITAAALGCRKGEANDTASATATPAVISHDPAPAPATHSARRGGRTDRPAPSLDRKSAPPPAPAAAPAVERVAAPAGSDLALAVSETLSSKTNKPGDGFTATVVNDVRSADGAVVIPAGAEARGTITAVK